MINVEHRRDLIIPYNLKSPLKSMQIEQFFCFKLNDCPPFWIDRLLCIICIISMVAKKVIPREKYFFHVYEFSFAIFNILNLVFINSLYQKRNFQQENTILSSNFFWSNRLFKIVVTSEVKLFLTNSSFEKFKVFFSIDSIERNCQIVWSKF